MPGTTFETDSQTGLPLIRKRSYDRITMTADFTDRIATGSQITEVNQVSARGLERIANAANISVTNPLIRDGALVVVTVEGGTSGEVYQLDIRISTSASERVEGVFAVEIE